MAMSCKLTAHLLTSSPIVPSRRPAGSLRPCVTARAGNFFRDLFDFDSWAPKSSKIWRLRQWEGGDRDKAARQEESDAEDAIRDLEMRINMVPASTNAQQINAEASKSFSDADDSELAQALSQRLGQLAASTSSLQEEEQDVEPEEDADAEPVAPLTGPELRQLVFAKYGKTHDMSIARRDFPGRKFVALNIMWSHLEQKSFKMTEDEYMDKIDSIAYLTNVLGQTAKVRSFLQQPARPHMGLPPRPVVGTAISIKFDLSDETISDWFGQGYQ